ncbi:MAG: SDR family NAD(P)-dependent oxidoreductase [Ignavibacteria bacterium]|nr:SDR family NAD(P)-dependent oxidoreductase [Ignavibacteria bacterium]
MTRRPLDGKRTLITGASSGIGLATARLFAEQGSDLLLLSRDAVRLAEVAAELRAAGAASVDILASDVSDARGLQRDIAAATAERPVDILIANAGIGQYGPYHLSPWDDIEAVLRTNIDGTMASARAVLPAMAARRAGSVVLVSSVLGKRAIQWNAAYCASKFALHGFADALRLEVKRLGIHVGVVCPARTDTAFFSRMIYSRPQRRQRAVPHSAPERVARAILRTVLRRRRETVVSLGGMLYAHAGYHFPRLSDLILSFAVPQHDDV